VALYRRRLRVLVSQRVGSSGSAVDGVGGSGGVSPLLPQGALDEKVRLNDRNAILNGDDDDEDILLDGSYSDKEEVQQRRVGRRRNAFKRLVNREYVSFQRWRAMRSIMG